MTIILNILAIEQPGLLKFNPPGHLLWRQGALLFLVAFAIAALFFGQNLLFAWRNWRSSQSDGSKNASLAAPAELEARIETEVPSGRVSAFVGQGMARTHFTHHSAIRKPQRFHVDNRVNKPRLRGYRQR